MRETKIERTARFFARMSELGFSYNEAQSLRRIEMTLQRWGELECGDGNDHCSWSVERDEQTNIPYLVTYPHTGKSYRRQIPDRESGALKRMARIMAKHPELWAYHQSDPRGCALYVGRKADVNGCDLSSVYTRGFAVSI